MSRETMKQALEAMDKATRYMSDSDYVKLNQAIEALRAALDAPEPEPVAWMHNMIEGVVVGHRPADLNRHPERWTALYTAPVAFFQLTDAEIQQCTHLYDNTAGWSLDTFARAIEAKLKEKNT
jgi:hypothetical protein